MAYLRRSGKLIFTGGKDVITYYTNLIDQLTPQLQGITLDDYKAIRDEIADLRRRMVEQLKNFGYRQADEYFNEAIASAESEGELYALSNAYEAMLMAELTLIKKKLHTLRTT